MPRRSRLVLVAGCSRPLQRRHLTEVVMSSRRRARRFSVVVLAIAIAGLIASALTGCVDDSGIAGSGGTGGTGTVAGAGGTGTAGTGASAGTGGTGAAAGRSGMAG